MGNIPPALFNLYLFMNVEEISSAIFNDVTSALAGANSNPAMDIYQLQDEVVAERERVILE